MSLSPDDDCRRCGEGRETAWHLLAECDSLEADRLQIFFEAESLSPPNPQKLYDFIHYTCVSGLLKHPEAEM